MGIGRPIIKLDIDVRDVVKLEKTPSGATPGPKNQVVIAGDAVIYVVRPGFEVTTIWCESDMKVSA